MAFRSALIATVGTLLAPRAGAVDNGLARTPQMGWNNWNTFGCSVSEDLLVGTADLIVKLGFQDLGYHYVVLDDCWSDGRDPSNNNALKWDTEKFPRGMAAVADDMHSRGLGFGMYSSAGRYTCGGFEGSLGHEEVDANTFAEWGVDYLKYDNCYNMGQAGNQLISQDRYAKMANALNATGRPILYSLCNWGEDYPWNWGSTIANSWRITGDVFDSFDLYDARCPCEGPDAWDCGLPGFHCSITNIMNKAAFVGAKGVPGGWNDLDMLEVGNAGLTDAEWISHFSLWAAVKSPLIMGNDIRVITPGAYSILANPAVIAVNQDPSGSSAARRWIYDVQGTDPRSRASIQMWSGGLQSTTGGIGDEVVLLINGNNETIPMNATLVDIFDGTTFLVETSWEVHDLWADRMSDEEAQAIIDGAASNATSTNTNSTMLTKARYNATQTSYAEGLAKNDTLLLGNLTSTVAPSGTITAMVEAHGAAMFRLRAIPTAAKKDEL